MEPFLRTAYNYDKNAAGNEDAINCQDPSLTKQSFTEESDINTIVKRFNLTGQLPTNVRMPTYADYNDVFDFHTAMNAIAQANEAFDKMPADIRARFHNNPAEFVDFCSNEANRAEAEKMGLVTAQALQAAANLATPPTPPTPVASAPPAPAAPASKGKE